MDFSMFRRIDYGAMQGDSAHATRATHRAEIGRVSSLSGRSLSKFITARYSIIYGHYQFLGKYGVALRHARRRRRRIICPLRQVFSPLLFRKKL